MPSGHCEHVVKPSSLYVPSEHTVQLPLLLYRPGPQFVHAVAPTLLTAPVEQFVHTLFPEVLLKVPAAQFVQNADPLSLYVPGGHMDAVLFGEPIGQL